MFRSNRWTLLLSCLALLAWPRSISADLDVAVPPGLPTDWVKGLPSPALTGGGSVPKARSEDGSVEVTPRTEYTVAAASAGFSGITTIDMPMHMPWTKPDLTGLTPKQVELTGTKKPSHKSRFPPPDSHPLHWLSMAILLRTDLHPATVSAVGSAEYLVLIGQPAHYAASRAQTTPALKAISERVLVRIGPMDRRKPTPPRGGSPYESMMLRMAMAEVASAHPYGPGKPFAARLRGLGAECVGPVIALTQHKHRFVRRNATTMLGAYTGELAAQQLLKLAKSRDHVIRNRALASLAERAEPSLAKPLAKLLSGDIGKVMLVADALGKTRSPDAIEPLRRLIAKSMSKPDLLWAAVPALGRVCGDDKRSRALLHKVYKTFMRRPGVFPVRDPSWRVDVPDKWTKAEVIAQLALCALATAGDAKAGKALLDLVIDGAKKNDPKAAERAKVAAQVARLRKQMMQVSTKMRAATGDARTRLTEQYRTIQKAYSEAYTKLRALGGGNMYAGRERGIALMHLAAVGRFIGCEALAKQGRAGHQRLLAVVEDRTEFAALRLHALDLLDMNKAVEKTADVASRLERWATGYTGPAPAPRPVVKPPAGEDKPKPEDDGPSVTLGTSLPSPLRARALARLERVDRKRAIEVAHKIVGGFLKLKPPAMPGKPDPKRPMRILPSREKLPSQEHWVVIPALQLLGRAGKNSVARIQKLIAFADTEYAVAQALKKQQDATTMAAKNMYSTLTNRVFTLPELLQVSLLELGRAEVDKGEGEKVLTARLAQAEARGRYPAAVALGGIQTKTSTARLIELLEDTDGWVRFGAYRALRTTSAKDFPADWLYGPDSGRTKAVAEWKAWASGTK